MNIVFHFYILFTLFLFLLKMVAPKHLNLTNQRDDLNQLGIKMFIIWLFFKLRYLY